MRTDLKQSPTNHPLLQPSRKTKRSYSTLTMVCYDLYTCFVVRCRIEESESLNLLLPQLYLNHRTVKIVLGSNNMTLKIYEPNSYTATNIIMTSIRIAMLILSVTNEIKNEVLEAIALVRGRNFTIDLTFS